MRNKLLSTVFSFVIASLPNAADNTYELPENVHVFTQPPEVVDDYFEALINRSKILDVRRAAVGAGVLDSGNAQDEVLADAIADAFSFSTHVFDGRYRVIHDAFKHFVQENVDEGKPAMLLFRVSNDDEIVRDVLSAMYVIGVDMPIIVAEIDQFYDLGADYSASQPSLQVFVNRFESPLASLNLEGEEGDLEKRLFSVLSQASANGPAGLEFDAAY